MKVQIKALIEARAYAEKVAECFVDCELLDETEL